MSAGLLHDPENYGGLFCRGEIRHPHLDLQHQPRRTLLPHSNRHSDIKFLYDGRVLIRDTNDNRYEIEDVKALDRRSQRILSGEL
ncbi:MAG: DUF1854 domain-containing protein [Ruminococcaceae bacterium]|nr:DUF1854 domain-containing protein [Oscillospiraceae bacterium]